MRLENSHRRFSIGMNDVAQAYAAAHAADRTATFKPNSEFVAVREYLADLRDHPDLSALEPTLLELEASVAAGQLGRLHEEMGEVLPELGMESIVRTNATALDNTVIEMPPKAAE